MRSRVFSRVNVHEFPSLSVLNLGSRGIDSRLQMRMHRPDAFFFFYSYRSIPLVTDPKRDSPESNDTFDALKTTHAAVV